MMKSLSLRGKCAVFIDWANVYGWTKSLKHEVDPVKLFGYLKAYSEIIEVRLYFGEDKHPKSTAFLEKAVQIGYTVIRKSVKYILIAEIEGQKVYRRKCDFDMETCIDVHRLLNDGFESFIFFTGDGDFEPLYRLLISKRKQVIVVYAHGHLGREIYQMHGGLYKVAIDKLTENVFKEMSTTSSGEGAK